MNRHPTEQQANLVQQAKIEAWLAKHGVIMLSDKAGVRLYKRGQSMTQAKTEAEAVDMIAYRMGIPSWPSIELERPRPSLLIPAGVSLAIFLALAIYCAVHS